MTGRLTNKTAIITGSSSGIGRATALALASEGANIVCSDITETFRPEYRTDSLSGTTLQEITNLGVRAIYQKCDTTSSADVENLVKRAVQEFGRVDIMVNNAGIAVETGEHGNRPIWDVDEEAFERTMRINVRGVFLGVKYASRQMKDQEPGANGDRGWIINLASVYGLGGGEGACQYPLPFCYLTSQSHHYRSIVHYVQTRGNGHHQSCSTRLRAPAYPRQRAVPGICADVVHRGLVEYRG
jgi:NAD(P)-dependent dehydrogenase (short-subunit alcohol dehydrogenase family)